MYNTLNEHYKEKFGCKVYKLSVDAGFSCPNRDGTVGSKGCIFCSEKGSGEFVKNLNRITKEYSVSLHEDVKKYTTMYDYRNNTENADWGNSRDAVERSIAFLTGNEVE